jgi:O-antigen biosynthesis protein
MSWQSAPSGSPEDSRWGAGRVEARGKFFFVGEEKLLLKGVTYGPFAPAADGTRFPDPSVVAQDFALVRSLGANCIRMFTAPARWVLDLALEQGLRALVGIPWAWQLCFLDDPRVVADSRRVVAQTARACQDHKAVAAYMIGNEIPPDIVRWYGPGRVQTFLGELAGVARDNDPGALIGYANFPSTEYLETDFADFLAFNVYLHHEREFRAYLARLQTLAGDRPLLLTELGVDAMGEGEDAQAAMLDWQLGAAFEMGLAGTFVFAWTDEWHTGGHEIHNWAFGLVTRDRRPKPAFSTVQSRYQREPTVELPQYPKVSVVVCAYNAERTLDDCLASLEHLRYPSYEVIVVNDGSNDRTAEIMARYDYIRAIHFEKNRGLSAARNAGMEAAVGDIVAYTDSDCVADPDWLTYLVATFESTGFAAVGGPNLSPPEDSLVASCVAVSPGGPLHVLLNDQEAEHVPGCNMAFRREVLEDIGGFDPMYRAAGDDVDVCWRLQDGGHRIGFSPSAVVWHYRRNTVRAYLRQQRGYGKAEALLSFRHPQRFNRFGYSRWRGRIYDGLGALLSLRRPVIYSGVFGRGLFQTLYQPAPGRLAFLPFTLEWNLGGLLLLLWAMIHGGIAWAGAIPLALSIALCVNAALRARLDPRTGRLRGRLLVAVLTYIAPLVRSAERYLWMLRGRTPPERVVSDRPLQTLPFSWRRRGFAVSYWTNAAVEKESILVRVIDALKRQGYFVVSDQGWSDWDVDVHGGVWIMGRLRACSENHGGQRRLLRVLCMLRPSWLGGLAVGACVAIAAVGAVLGAPFVTAGALGVGVLVTGLIARDGSDLVRVLYEVVHVAARKTRLRYVPRRGGERREVARS